MMDASLHQAKLIDPHIMGLQAMARRRRDEKTKDLFAYADDNRPSIVYVATNKNNGKRYIGITRLGLEKRRKAHMKGAKYETRYGSRFYKAIRRYGEDAFLFETLLQCATYKEAAQHEVRLIAEMKPEYNLSNGGEGAAHVGSRPTEETRQRMREARLRNPNRYWLGKKRPEIAQRARERLLANPMRYWAGKKRDPETIEKLRTAQRRVGMTPNKIAGNFRRRKPIICLNDGRVFIGGAKEAAETYGIRYDCIFGVLRGRNKSHMGYRFAYYTEVKS